MVKYIPTELRKYQIIPNCFGTNRIIEKLQTILSLLIMGNTKITGAPDKPCGVLCRC